MNYPTHSKFTKNPKTLHIKSRNFLHNFAILSRRHHRVITYLVVTHQFAQFAQNLHTNYLSE